MKKSIIFMTLVGIMVLGLCGSVAATADSSINTTNLTNNRHVFINVSNDNGVKYNTDGSIYSGPNNTYYIKADGGGMNELHITNDSSISSAYGQVSVINATSTSSSGVFYITNTGGRGYSDDMILLISVEGPIPDNFSIKITSSGYTWTVTGTTPTNYAYTTGVNETFTKSDFQYGATTYKPGPGALGTWSLPLYYGQNTSDSSTSSYLMFVDLCLGTLKGANFPGLTDNGAVKVEYTITGLTSTAAFNVYGWTGAANQGQGISWTNRVQDSGSSGYSVNYTPITPVANFTADNTSGSNSLTVNFTDTSTNYPLSWLWDFGDGTTSTEQNPTHTYSKAGTYTVTLTAANPAGSDDEIKTNYITVLDTIAPTVTANPVGGNFDNVQNITLTTDEPATIYYTTDGSTPTTSSTQYTGPININGTITLKFFAVDAAGNASPVQSETYTIKFGVYVNITPSNSNPQVGDKVTYTFKLGNKGPGIAKDVVFTYVIPDGVEFAGASVDQGTWSYNETTRTLTWTLGDVAVGDPYLWLDLNVLSAGSFNINPTVTVSGEDIGSEGNIGSLLISVPTTVNAATETNTVPMQKTGVPIAGLAMALLMVGSGLALGKRK
ncbi:chitobiase/beta-hexosaminidase C-terminal domain-containing protein [Methanobacterium oryzae]|uniref:chitobiase/beta-hexosaminidase C-terminal domain-containing protein n=1 Tax=Methanobacterium oryzae TaxID=69540 RepID=UPI003D198C6A